MQARSWSQIPGGVAAFEDAFAEVALVAAVTQARFAAHLARLGPPGSAAWDPIEGRVTLRGHDFDAEQIGSFDGESWLWSWANHHLRIPEDKTSMARALRDGVDVAALRVPMIAAADERLPYMMAAFALAHTDAAGYYIANHSQVYAVHGGSVPRAPQATIDEVRQALRMMRGELVMPFDAPRALRFAARRLGLALEERDGQLRIRSDADAGAPLVEDIADGRLQQLAIAFLPRRSFPELLAVLDVPAVPSLSQQPGASTAELSGEGWRVQLRYADRSDAVRDEAQALPARADEARGKGIVVVVWTESDGALRDRLVPSRGERVNGWMPAELIRDAVGGVAGPALDLCEALADLPGALVYDVALRRFFDE